MAGWTFQLAVEVLQQLHRVRHQPLKGLRPSQLAQLLRVDGLLLEDVLQAGAGAEPALGVQRAV